VREDVEVFDKFANKAFQMHDISSCHFVLIMTLIRGYRKLKHVMMKEKEKI